MRLISKLFMLTVGLLFWGNAEAQTPTPQTLDGVWKGTYIAPCKEDKCRGTTTIHLFTKDGKFVADTTNQSGEALALPSALGETAAVIQGNTVSILYTSNAQITLVWNPATNTLAGTMDPRVNPDRKRSVPANVTLSKQ